jgi:hypothetical protein
MKEIQVYSSFSSSTLAPICLVDTICFYVEKQDVNDAKKLKAQPTRQDHEGSACVDWRYPKQNSARRKIVQPYYPGGVSDAIKDLIQKAILEQEISHKEESAL